MRPIIGISATFLEEKQQILLRETYTNSIIEAGGLAFIMPPVCDDAIIDAYLNQIDGLLLSGGGDVDPAHYAAERTQECGEPNIRRDEFELRIVKRAIALRMPIFGICRGIQVLNVAYGGSLIQDISSALSIASDRHRQPEPFDVSWHEIRLCEGGILSRISGGLAQASTNSMHHQAIAKLGGTLVAEAATEDGIIEAVSDSKNPAVFGVQFHPEFLTGCSSFARALFSYFVDAANQYHRLKQPG